jgi:ABC transporter substrate binding protein
MGLSLRRTGLQAPGWGWQLSRRISGRLPVESVAAFAWNQWQLSCGTGGSFRVESVAGLAWNTHPMHQLHVGQIIDFATQHRLPVMSNVKENVVAGALMSYGASLPELYKRATLYVDKILKGATPGDLPVQQPMKFELVINLKTAKALGLTIPPTLLYQADEVIQ